MIDCIISNKKNYKNNSCFIFIQNKFIEWDLEKNKPISRLYERKTHPFFNKLPDIFLESIDSGFSINDLAYLFSGHKWILWNLDTNTGSDMFNIFDDARYQFRQLPFNKIDCCLVRNEQQVYFFRNDIFVLYDIIKFKVIYGPKKINTFFPFNKIDSCVKIYQKDCYLFYKNKWVRYNLEKHKIIYGPYDLYTNDFKKLYNIIKLGLDLNECSFNNVNMLIDNCRYLKHPDSCREMLKCNYLKYFPDRAECRKLRIPVSICDRHIIDRTKRRCGIKILSEENTLEKNKIDFHVKDIPCEYKQINKWHEFCKDFGIQDKCNKEERDKILNTCKDQISGIYREVYDKDVPLPQKLCDPKVYYFKKKEEKYVNEGGPAYATRDKKRTLTDYPILRQNINFNDASIFDRREFAPEDRAEYNKKFENVIEGFGSQTNNIYYILFVLLYYIISECI